MWCPLNFSPENAERLSLKELLSIDSVRRTGLLVIVFAIYNKSTNSIVPKSYRYDDDTLGTEGFLTKSIKK